MIHEGQSAHCGHYYDLIKDPTLGKWFSYNDKSVAEVKVAPGVTAEKQSIGRSQPDMRGCYALIYRKKEAPLVNGYSADDDQLLALAPAKMVDEIRDEVSELQFMASARSAKLLF